MLTLNRPATIEDGKDALDAECRSARWTYHRLLDFEDEHQKVLDRTAEECAPGIVRVGRLVARLARRARRAERTTKGQWCPPTHPELAERLRTRLGELRKARNADPRWKQALKWADEPVGDPIAPRRRLAKPPEKVKRRKNETDEAFRKRFELLTQDETDEHFAAKVAKARRRTRRDQYRAEIYATRRIYWGTWNALVRSADQARKDVLSRRKQGMPSEIRRPQYRDPISLSADKGGFRVVGRDIRGRRGGPIWWIIEMRIGKDKDPARWVRFRAKCGNWHRVPKDAQIRTAKLTRRKDGERWSYSVSLTIEIDKPEDDRASRGTVSFDWGHREHGHDRERDGIRVFRWCGDDGREGEVLIPIGCRQMLDEIDQLKTRVDEAFNARKKARGLPERNRHNYRRRLMRSGVRTEEEALWLNWEMRCERRIARRRKRIAHIRRETYLMTVRRLRQRYATFFFEDESVDSLKRTQKEEQMRRRQRANRDLATRYEFASICERYGAEIISVTARNSTRECPECGGLLEENGPELLVVCPQCGTTRDKDVGAARVILQRGKEALENRDA